MAELETLHEEIRSCTSCKLSGGRSNAVPGEGPDQADILFIGEAPGFHEDKQGRPFVGAAGQFLEELLSSIDMSREDVFITNVVKCRPPANRDPEPDEIDACRGYLDRQIELLQPRMVVTLGRFSMARYFPNARISRIHGQAKKVGNRLVVPFFHPAAALHQGSLRPTVEEDFARLPELITQMGEMGGEEAPPPDEPKQLSLF